MPRLLAAHPQILVSDMQRAVAFYTGTLGFRVVFLYGEPPFYGLVERDGAGLNLRHVDDPARYRAPESEQVLAANIPAEGVKALFLGLERGGADFAQRLKEQPWGTQDFVLRDPDGNLLCFAEAAASAG
jgi:catechol 2,3-dioxygenase-like lactoylglutathione lyase family enzyme